VTFSQSKHLNSWKKIQMQNILKFKKISDVTCLTFLQLCKVHPFLKVAIR
jgi:hypothetical protein